MDGELSVDLEGSSQRVIADNLIEQVAELLGGKHIILNSPTVLRITKKS